MGRKLIIASLLLLSTGFVHGEIYKWVDSMGNVHYADSPQNDQSERIELSQPTIYSSPNRSVPTPPVVAAPKKNPDKNYLNFSITYPANKSVVRNIEEGLIVTFAASPSLFDGHYIQLIVDGNILPAKINSLSYPLDRLDRGTHFLQSSIMDKDGRLKKRAPVVQFHVRKEVVTDDATTPVITPPGHSGNKSVDAPQYAPGLTSDFKGSPPSPGQDNANFKPGANPGYAPSTGGASHTPGQTNPVFKPAN